jgi:hypothetical protein
MHHGPPPVAYGPTCPHERRPIIGRLLQSCAFPRRQSHGRSNSFSQIPDPLRRATVLAGRCRKSLGHHPAAQIHVHEQHEKLVIFSVDTGADRHRSSSHRASHTLEDHWKLIRINAPIRIQHHRRRLGNSLANR